MNIKLPKELERKIIFDLKDNIPVYITPWSIHVDQDGFMWVHISSSYSNESGGTSCVRVVKKNSSMSVWLLKDCSEHRWEKGKLPNGEYYPVVSFKREK